MSLWAKLRLLRVREEIEFRFLTPCFLLRCRGFLIAATLALTLSGDGVLLKWRGGETLGGRGYRLRVTIVRGGVLGAALEQS